MGDRGTVPTINLNDTASASSAVAIAGNMLNNIAQTFQAALGTLVEANINAQHQQAQVIAQTVANAVQSCAQQFQNIATEARERDVRFLMEMQRETLEGVHKRELERLTKAKKEAEKKEEEEEQKRKRARTEAERPQDAISLSLSLSLACCIFDFLFLHMSWKAHHNNELVSSYREYYI